jgi:hypothetical protein
LINYYIWFFYLPYALEPLTLLVIHIIFDKFSANSFQIKLKDRSTATNLLDEALQKDLIKRLRREERKGSIVLDILRMITNYRYTIIKVENREYKKGKRLSRARRFTT